MARCTPSPRWLSGAQGYLSSEGNLAPRLCVEVVDAHRDGRSDDAASAFARLIRLFRATQAAGGIVGTKAALRALGAPGGWPRPPRRDPDPVRVEALVEVLTADGLAAAEGLPTP